MQKMVQVAGTDRWGDDTTKQKPGAAETDFWLQSPAKWVEHTSTHIARAWHAYSSYMGRHKNTTVFLPMVQKSGDPPFLPSPVFFDKDFLDWARPPPLLAKNMQKIPSFSDKPPLFWQNMPKNLIFSDKPLLDWVRPPPPLCQKNLSIFW